MLTCNNCGNDFEEGICSDCEIELRAEVQKAAERTPLELAAGDLFNACRDIVNLSAIGMVIQLLNKTASKIDNKKEAGLFRGSAIILKKLQEQCERAFTKAQDNQLSQANPAAEDVEQI